MFLHLQAHRAQVEVSSNQCPNRNLHPDGLSQLIQESGHPACLQFRLRGVPLERQRLRDRRQGRRSVSCRGAPLASDVPGTRRKTKTPRRYGSPWRSSPIAKPRGTEKRNSSLLPGPLVQLSGARRSQTVRITDTQLKDSPSHLPGATPKCLYHSLPSSPSSWMNPRSNATSFAFAACTLSAALMKRPIGPLGTCPMTPSRRRFSHSGMGSP